MIKVEAIFEYVIVVRFVGVENKMGFLIRSWAAGVVIEVICCLSEMMRK